MDELKQILNLYQIVPHSITKLTERVYKIHDGHHYYALKKSHLTSDTVRHFEFVYHQAHHLFLPHVLPVVMTTEGQLHVTFANQIYYLLPWIDNREDRLAVFFHAIGQIHAKTKQTYYLDQETDLVHVFTQYKAYCQTLERRWLSYIELFEQKRYMSPFELQGCTHFREIMIAFRLLYERIDGFLDLIKEEEKWSYSLCHGNLKRAHFLYDQQGYFINWEQALLEHPVVDLSRFFKHEMIDFQVEPDVLVNQFSAYMDENKLEINELYLLIIYLLDPSEYVSLIEQYVKRPKDDSMIHQVMQLEQQFRQLQFGLFFSEHVKNEYEFLKFDDDLESS